MHGIMFDRLKLPDFNLSKGKVSGGVIATRHGVNPLMIETLV